MSMFEKKKNIDKVDVLFVLGALLFIIASRIYLEFYLKCFLAKRVRETDAEPFTIYGQTYFFFCTCKAVAAYK